MEQPLAVYRGEVFDRIKIYRDRVVCQGKKGRVVLSKEEVPCLTCQPCKAVWCRHWIHLSDLGNCCMNIDRCYDYDEIAKAVGLNSRQRVEQILSGNNGSVVKGGKKYQLKGVGLVTTFGKRLMKVTHSRHIRDLLPDPPILPYKSKHKKVNDQ